MRVPDFIILDILFEVQPFREPGDTKNHQRDGLHDENKAGLGLGEPAQEVIQKDGNDRAEHHQATDYLLSVGELPGRAQPFAREAKYGYAR